MKYEKLLEILNASEKGVHGYDRNIEKLLSPRPLTTPEELHQMISTRFRYTGPGKWVKILCDNTAK